MICVPESSVVLKAAKMPVAYLAECRAAAKVAESPTMRMYCFKPEDFYRIRKKYRGYAVSEADRFREGEIISGCCDRADQY